MQEYSRKIRDISLAAHRDLSYSIADSIGQFSTDEALAILDLARAELLLEKAQHSRIINDGREENRG